MDIRELKAAFKIDFIDALATLEFSWNKLKDSQLPDFNSKNLNEFEPWEAFASRFARTTDIFLSKYIRILVLELDPGFHGEIRDFLDKAEKAHLVSSADQWMKIRELRNKVAHEYTKEDLEKTLKDILRFTPFVISELGKYKN